MEKFASVEENNTIIIQESPASLFVANAASTRSAKRRQDSTNAYQSASTKNFVPQAVQPSSTAEYQGYYDCRPREQSRPLSQLAPNPRTATNHSASRHNKHKDKMMDNISLYNSMNEGVANNSSHNIMYQGEDCRYSPMAASASQRS